MINSLGLAPQTWNHLGRQRFSLSSVLDVGCYECEGTVRRVNRRRERDIIREWLSLTAGFLLSLELSLGCNYFTNETFNSFTKIILILYLVLKSVSNDKNLQFVIKSDLSININNIIELPFQKYIKLITLSRFALSK